MHLRGVRQRTKHIEGRREAERTAHRGGKAHRRVHFVSEKERDADLIENGAQLINLDVQVDAQRLDHVGRTGLRRGRPVTVLNERNAHRGQHDRGHGRNVDGLVAVPARADDVEGAAGQVHALRVILHAISEAMDLLDRGSLDRHGSQEGGEAGFTQLAAHHLVHEPVGLVVVQRLTGDKGSDDRTPFAPTHRAAPRKTSATVS